MAKRKGPTPRRTVQSPRPQPKQPGLSARVLLALLVVGGVVVSFGVFALTRGDHGSGGGRLSEAMDPGPVHVHGLGVNPVDRSLLIATHTGTYRVGTNQRRAERVGNSLQDTMGFTVAGANRFLGSGHPDLGEARDKNLPPLLGLIESRDAGRTWRPISLLGEADFHVLRLAGSRIYGYDASNDRLLLSKDEGRTWKERPRPTQILDLAIDRAHPSRLVATGEGGLYLSNNEGRGWNRLAPHVGFVAWPSPESLYLIDGEGTVLLSTNAGRNWRRLANVGGQPAALLAQTAEELYVALHDGTIKTSLNAGRTWTVRSAP